MSQTSPAPKLQRILGVTAGIAVSMGVAIGAGIFRNPGEVAALLPNGTWILLAWVAGGALTLVDALVLAELSTSYPKAGGWYNYLRAAYGDFPAFLYGWAASLITYPGSIAAVAVAIGEYTTKLVQVSAPQSWFLPNNPMAVKAVAVTAIVVFTILNLAGLKIASWTQQIFTSIKVLVLLLIVAIAFGVSGTNPGMGASVGGAPPPTTSLLIAFGIALQFVVWTYDGYADVITLAEEVRDPGKSLPRALLGSIGMLTGLYVFINLAFLYVLTPVEMAGAKELVAAEMVQRRIGTGGFVMLTAMALVTVIGGLNAHLLSGPRITFALSRDGLSFAWLSRVTKLGTPIGSLLLHSGCAVLLTLSGTFEQLISMTIFIIWITNTLNAFAVFLFRFRYPDRERPFKIPGYPVVPILALLVQGCLLLNMVYDSRTSFSSGLRLVQTGQYGGALAAFLGSPVISGIVIVAAGIPVYWVWQRFLRTED
ncbi:MAG: amino acid permease [Blastocatellia bacterium]|nr:amino acid permease [Blastocatellia bacterium]